jgi:hypothetical protein
MISRIGTALCFAVAACLTMVGQTEPILTAANIPKYPPLARQSRVEGVVKLSFVLPANAGEPINVEVVSGHPLLKGWTIENVKTWKFENSYAVDRKYETTFRYQLSADPASPRIRVTFESFHHVDVVSVPPEASANN